MSQNAFAWKTFKEKQYFSIINTIGKQPLIAKYTDVYKEWAWGDMVYMG